jgi:hypothetical protein
MNFTLEFFHQSKPATEKNDERKTREEVKEEKEFQSNVHASSNGTYSSKKNSDCFEERNPLVRIIIFHAFWLGFSS